MVTLRTRHFPKIRLGVVTQVAKKYFARTQEIGWQPSRLWLDQCARSTVGVALASENLLESADVQKRKQKAFSGKIVAGD
jgi:hypothetical protein